jgi:hypothetical protein
MKIARSQLKGITKTVNGHNVSLLVHSTDGTEIYGLLQPNSGGIKTVHEWTNEGKSLKSADFDLLIPETTHHGH